MHAKALIDGLSKPDYEIASESALEESLLETPAFSVLSAHFTPKFLTDDEGGIMFSFIQLRKYESPQLSIVEKDDGVFLVLPKVTPTVDVASPISEYGSPYEGLGISVTTTLPTQNELVVVSTDGSRFQLSYFGANLSREQKPLGCLVYTLLKNISMRVNQLHLLSKLNETRIARYTHLHHSFVD